MDNTTTKDRHPPTRPDTASPLPPPQTADRCPLEQGRHNGTSVLLASAGSPRRELGVSVSHGLTAVVGSTTYRTSSPSSSTSLTHSCVGAIGACTSRKRKKTKGEHEGGRNVCGSRSVGGERCWRRGLPQNSNTAKNKPGQQARNRPIGQELGGRAVGGGAGTATTRTSCHDQQHSDEDPLDSRKHCLASTNPTRMLSRRREQHGTRQLPSPTPPHRYPP